MTRPIDAMLECMANGNPVYLPSKFWEAYNAKNRRELDEAGFENLKRTIATNYFTWVLDWHHEQFRTLVRETRARDWPAVLGGLWRRQKEFRLDTPVQVEFGRLPRKIEVQYTMFTRMLWKLAERRDTDGLLARLSEPTLGNPFPVYLGGKLISQDMANSFMEYAAVREHFRPKADARVTICELGAGYGRNAFVIANALPKAKYVIVDIPPALDVSQRYLSAVLPGRRVFGFRCFSDFESVRDEYEAADLAFLLPHQAEMLPAKSVDLFLNISSLHEMTMAQVAAYFGLIDRVTRGHFYSKQWYVSENPHDKIQIRHTDYPVPPHWRELYLRTTPVQRSFFEAMYALPAAASEAVAAESPAGAYQEAAR